MILNLDRMAAENQQATRKLAGERAPVTVATLLTDTDTGRIPGTAVYPRSSRLSSFAGDTCSVASSSAMTSSKATSQGVIHWNRGGAAFSEVNL